MKLKTCLFLVALLLSFVACETKIEPQTVNLWNDGEMPYDNHLPMPEKVIGNGYLIEHVSIPQLTIYMPKKQSGQVVIVSPGGGYSSLAMDLEGRLFAEWLNTIDVTAIVLKYRMPNAEKEIPLADIQQAINYVRKNASQLGIDPHRVGVAGFSAGGHIATLAATRFAEESNTRPDFSILYYPVITMGEYAHKGTRTQLLGDSLQPEDIDFYSNELHITKDTPPTIIFVSDDDAEVDPMNSLLYYKALRENGVSVSMHAFPQGGHGWGMSPEHMEFIYYNEMLNLLEKWLANR